MAIEIPKDFFEEEVRCDYRISAEMKKVWAAELDLYSVFDAICKKYDIPYFWAYGNLLGAVRHQGFIPWDDDLDVFLMRKDYERFCNVAAQEISYPYFLQDDHVEPGSHIAFTKLRNSETTAILDFEAPYRYRYNQGIFFDIFPLDNLPDDPKEVAVFTKKIVFLKRMTSKWARVFDSRKFHFGRKWVYISVPFLKLARLIVHGLNIPNIPCRLLEKNMQKYNDRQTQNVSMMGLGEVKSYPRCCFDDTVMMPFEFFEVPVPVGYLELLECDYGDWHKFVQGAAGGSMHEGVNYDTEHSYKNYI